MARLLLSVMILYSLHHPFIQVHSVKNLVKSLFCAGRGSRNQGAESIAETTAGPSSRTANWDSSRMDNRFREKCERFRRTLRNQPCEVCDYRSTYRPVSDISLINVKRGSIFEDSFTETIGFDARNWKQRHIIRFRGESAVGDGVKREWYTLLMRSFVDTEVQLFIASDGDRDAYTINPHKPASDDTLRRFTFIGHVVGKAVYEGQLLPMYFTRSMYKLMLGKQVDCTDMEIEDPRYYQSLKYILETDITTINEVLGEPLTWTVKVDAVQLVLIPGGNEIAVTNAQRDDYVKLACEMKLHTVIQRQLDAFLAGFYDIIPKDDVLVFNEQELDLVISGPPVIDVKDWKANTRYSGYSSRSQIIKWFWETLESFNQEQLGRFLHFVTGSSKPPLRGFKYLDGNDEGSQKFEIIKGNVLKASVWNVQPQIQRIITAKRYELIFPSYFKAKRDLERVLLVITETFSEGFRV